MRATLVFVYGTLKRGLSNHGWLLGQNFRGAARTLPKYRMFDLGGYPGMVAAGVGGGVMIEGEVWEVDDHGLRGLHLLEGLEQGEYAFEKVALEAPWDSEEVMGYLYLNSIQGRREVGGCWTEGKPFDGVD